MIKTAPAASGTMNKVEAKALTDRIRNAVDGLGSLVEQAHDRAAWKAMGYSTWEAYVKAEFGFTRQRSYQLLDQGRVAKELASAAGDLSNAFDISARDASAVKAVLPAVKAQIKAKVAAGETPEKAVAETVAAARADKEQKREEKKVEQAKNDAYRDENLAALPPAVKAQEDAKAKARSAKQSGPASNNVIDALVVAQDRIAELEEEVAVLEKENTILAVKIKVFSEMEVEWRSGGFAEVIKGKDEVIAVQATRIERESTDKVSWKRAADLWKKRAEEAGWSNDVVIDINPREAAHG